MAQYWRLRQAGAGIDGIGMQSHMSGVCPAAVLRKLDILGAPGLPVWLTEVCC